MKAKKIISIVMVMCGLAFWPLPAEGTLITIEIEAVVDAVEDVGNYLEGKINPGDTITGFYIYESTTPDSNPSASVGIYEHYTSPHGIFLSVGGFNFQTDLTNVDFVIGIVNDDTFGGLHDSYSLVSYNNIPLPKGTSVDMIYWWLYDPTGSALSSDALLTTAPVLEDWQTNFLVIEDSGHPHAPFGIRAHVTSAIPEPTSIILLGLSGLLLIKRR
jgi:hypothetical protein